MNESSGERRISHPDHQTTCVEGDLSRKHTGEDFHDFRSESEGGDHDGGRAHEGPLAGFRRGADARYLEELTVRSVPRSIRQIPVAELDRGVFTVPLPPSIDALAESIGRFGVVQPLLVTPSPCGFRVVDGARRLQAAVLAGLRHVPCIVHELDDAAAGDLRAAANLRSDFERSDLEERGARSTAGDATFPAGVCWSLAGIVDNAQREVHASRQGGFRGALAADILQADLLHAARVARAAAIVMAGPILRRRQLGPLEAIQDAVAATALARRLAGIGLETVIDDHAFRVPADARLVTQALAGALDVMLELLAGVCPASVTLNVHCARPRPAMLMELTQTSVEVASTMIERFFDPLSPNHPAGASGALLLAASDRIVRAHGGRTGVTTHGPAGCTLTFILPQAASL